MTGTVKGLMAVTMCAAVITWAGAGCSREEAKDTATTAGAAAKDAAHTTADAAKDAGHATADAARDAAAGAANVAKDAGAVAKDAAAGTAEAAKDTGDAVKDAAAAAAGKAADAAHDAGKALDKAADAASGARGIRRVGGVCPALVSGGRRRVQPVRILLPADLLPPAREAASPRGHPGRGPLHRRPMAK